MGEFRRLTNIARSIEKGIYPVSRISNRAGYLPWATLLLAITQFLPLSFELDKLFLVGGTYRTNLG